MKEEPVNITNPQILKQGFVVPAVRTYSLHRFPAETDVEGENIRVANAKAYDLPSGRPLDISWLKAAAETYRISPDYRDYIITEVPIVTADYPNRNMDCFSYKELTYFSPLYGCFTYNTFKGKPTHINHDNRDPHRAKGVVFDATFVKSAGGIYHTNVALGFDRTKDQALVQEIIESPINGYSMGALVSYTTCSICGFKANGRVYCEEHIGFRGMKKGQLFNRRIAFENCNGVNYIEVSRVKSPADINAFSEIKMYL